MTMPRPPEPPTTDVAVLSERVNNLIDHSNRERAEDREGEAVWRAELRTDLARIQAEIAELRLLQRTQNGNVATVTQGLGDTRRALDDHLSESRQESIPRIADLEEFRGEHERLHEREENRAAGRQQLLSTAGRLLGAAEDVVKVAVAIAVALIGNRLI